MRQSTAFKDALMATPAFTPLFDQLNQMDYPGNFESWFEAGPERNPDYVTQLGLRPEHIPELITIAQRWVVVETTVEIVGEDIDENAIDLADFAPIHAWRALGQLQASAAIEPLLGMLEPLDKQDDDWFWEDFPEVFALIGPAALTPLINYLNSPEHTKDAKACVIDSLAQLGLRHPELRDQVVTFLHQMLANYATQDPFHNACLVVNLTKLKAVEAAETIERAYADNCIDQWYADGWPYIKHELGVPGLGLVPDSPPAESPLRSMFNPLFDSFGDSLNPELTLKKKRALEAKKKAKRKQAKKARKRNKR